MDDFDERLRRRLSALDAVVPPAAIRVRPVGSRFGARQDREVRMAGKLPIGLAAALVVAIVGVAMLGLGLHRSTPTGPAASGTATRSANPSGSSVILGSDGMPTEIDGQRVYRVADQAEWGGLAGSFLLAAGAPYGPPLCPQRPNLVAGAETGLLGCGAVVLFNSPSGGGGIMTAPKGLPLDGISRWGGQAVVVRAHTHDSEAALCSAAERAACEAAVVIETVVWPTEPISSPTRIDSPTASVGTFAFLTTTGAAGSNQRAGSVACSRARKDDPEEGVGCHYLIVRS